MAITTTSSRIAERLGLDNEVRELRLGKSFTNNGNTAFHSVRYDFKPASVDSSKGAIVDVGEGHQVMVSVPHVEGSGTSQTVFKGCIKPYKKECVLIINHDTGEVTLEKLNSNIQLKKTRAEGASRIQSHPVNSTDNKKHSHSPHQKHSPIRKDSHSPPSKMSWPTTNHYSPNQRTSPYQRSPTSQPSPSMPSLFVPFNETSKNSIASNNASLPLYTREDPVRCDDEAPEVGVLSDSGDSSSSGSSSDDGENEKMYSHLKSQATDKSGIKSNTNVSQKHSSPSLPSMPQFSQLSEDLQLSDSGSDSDS